MGIARELRALLSLLFIGVVSFKVEGCIIAQCASIKRDQNCTFSVSDVPDTTACDTTLRQVFRLLDVNDNHVLIGSTECLYALTRDLTYAASQRIPQPDNSQCPTLGYTNPEFICQNYISNWFNVTNNPTSFQVCGTYDVVNPTCWQCSYDNMNLSCDIDNGNSTQRMPTDPLQDVTAIKTEDGSQSQYFIAGLQQYSRPNSANEFQIGRVLARDGREDIVTADNNDQILYAPVSFVGKPIEHGNFIYFFFRERALENYLQKVTYSRVARVCKNDTGGVTNPLNGDFTTYLKARLMCSCGSEFPMIYNEIQDIDVVEQGNDKMIYGLFTKPRSRISNTTAICRYSLTEIETLFNNDNRRGAESDNELFTERPKDSDDSPNQRETCGEYAQGTYQHLLDYPLLNTNVPNCGFSTSCSDYTRSSDNALAVFVKIRGQQLAVYDHSDEMVNVYIGTDNRRVLEVYINTTNALITDDITLTTENLSDTDVTNKWPYGISSLRIRNGAVYGNMDNCAFRIRPADMTDIPPVECNSAARRSCIFERRDSEHELANHTVNIDGAITRFYTLFDAPADCADTKMVPKFSGLFNETVCTWARFTPVKKEVLHVSCEINTAHIKNVQPDVCKGSELPDGVITIESRVSGMVLCKPCNVTIRIDCSQPSDVNKSKIKTHDDEMAQSKYNLNRWIREETEGASSCPASSTRWFWLF